MKEQIQPPDKTPWEIQIRITRNSVFKVVAIALLVGVGIGAGAFLKDYPAHHFGIVKEGVLYRSGQPKWLGWRKLLGDYGIKTVVSVRELDPEADWFQLEEDLCRARNVSVERMPVGSVTDADVVRFMKIMNRPNAKPVLIHCEAGSVRTGVIVAAWRMIEEGWNYAKAITEANSFGFREDSHLPYTNYLRDLEKRMATQPELRACLRRGETPTATSKLCQTSERTSS